MPMVDYTAINIGAVGLVGIIAFAFQIYLYRSKFEEANINKVNEVINNKKYLLNQIIEKIHSRNEMKKKKDDQENPLYDVATQEETLLINEIANLGNRIQDMAVSINKGKEHLKKLFVILILIGVLFFSCLASIAFNIQDGTTILIIIMIYTIIIGIFEWKKFSNIEDDISDEYQKLSGFTCD
ncbi:MAG: hypothetical protein AB9819_07425 [Methanomassiliicoccales archaeon]